MASVAEADFLVGTRGLVRDLGAWVLAAEFGRDGRSLFYALADGRVAVVEPREAEADWTFCDVGAALLSATADVAAGLMAGTDDGRLLQVSPQGAVSVLARYGSRWIDHVAAHPSGVRAAAVGKLLHLLDGKGAALKTLPAHPSSVGGIAFDTKGKRVAASHYGGVSLWYVAAREDKPRSLPWKGSHQAVLFDPSGEHVVTAMQEASLHGWRLSDGQHMRMSGYPGKTRSMAFTGRGRWLATSGAESIVLWPFFAGGPMGKAPTELAGGDAVLCSAVACHPEHEVVAAGFEDGLVLLAEITSGKVVPVAPPGGGAVTSLAWNAPGSHLAFGTEQGRAGLVDLTRK